MNTGIRQVKWLLAPLLACSLLTVSCSREKSGTGAEEKEASLTMSEADAEAETIFNNIFDDAMGVNNEVGMAGTGIFGNTPGPNPCYSVSISRPTANAFPVQVLIDFGNSNCAGADGHTRRGKLSVLYSGRLIIPGATATITYHNFYFDDIRVEGSHTIKNPGTPGSIPPARRFSLELSGVRLTRANGNFTEWNSTKTITQTEGLATPEIPADDVFSITGTGSGKAQKGSLLVAWESNVVEPLIKRFVCARIVRGTIKTERASAGADPRWDAVLDFGTGTCDRKAVIAVNGVSTEITLR